ncbi:MAG: septum formation protein Maf [Thermotogaceae bacterium]|nr:septum formation protein Maf [Thermotogaceae bacterium]
MRIILASSSPRRKELLKRIGIDFEVIPPKTTEENMKCKKDPAELVKYLSFKKAKEVYERTFDERLVIAADTIVVFNGKILGKPKTPQEAKNFLITLSGKSHEVYTGVYFIWDGGEHFLSEKTAVWFRKLPDYIVDKYIKIGSPFDKAGGYGIQDLGSVFVEKIEGDFYNVMGFPIGKVWSFLYKKGWWR